MGCEGKEKRGFFRGPSLQLKERDVSANPSTYLLGLTGGIATGKSTVGKMLQELGAHCLDTDELAHEAIRRGQPAYERILNLFGPQVLGPDGEVDRKKLGDLVFRDQELRSALEKMVHPEVAKLLQERLAEITASVVVVIVPLLYEARMEGFFREVWVVACQKGEQIRRLVRRDALTEEDAYRRIHAQMPLAEKIKRADVVIDNNKDLESTQEQVKRAWEGLRKRV